MDYIIYYKEEVAMIMRKKSKAERKALVVRLDPDAFEVLDRIASKYGCSYSYAINYLILKLSKHLLSELEKEPFPIVTSVKETTSKERFGFDNVGGVKEGSSNRSDDTDLSKVLIRW